MNSTNVKSVDIERPTAAAPDRTRGSQAEARAQAQARQQPAQLVVHLQNWSLRPALCWCTVHLPSVPVCVCVLLMPGKLHAVASFSSSSSSDGSEEII